MSLPDPAPVLKHPGLVDDYRPLPGCYAEMRPSAGEVSPHWQYLLDALRTLGPAGIEEWSLMRLPELLDRILLEHQGLGS